MLYFIFENMLVLTNIHLGTGIGMKILQIWLYNLQVASCELRDASYFLQVEK